MPRRIQPGLLTRRDADDLNARLERLERLAVQPGDRGGAGVQGAGGTVVPRYRPRREFWALLTEVGDYIPAGAGSGSGGSGSGGIAPPEGCAPAYAWQEFWDDESGCLVKRPAGLEGTLLPWADNALLPAFDVNYGITDVPCVVWLREGRNSPFWYFDRCLAAQVGSGSGAPGPVRVSDLIQCTADGAQVRDACIEVRSGRVVLTDCHGHELSVQAGWYCTKAGCLYSTTAPPTYLSGPWGTLSECAAHCPTPAGD